MIEDELKNVHDFIFYFQYYNPKTKGYNKIDFDYKVPSIKGIFKYDRGKDLESVNKSTLEYIIANLHNAEIKTIIDAIIAYFYYWKIRKNDTQEMRKQYNNILEHYTVKNRVEVPKANIQYEAIVYSISFNIGSIKVNKFGIATDKERYKKLISDVRSKYEYVSVGNFVIHQEIQFETLEQAESFEKEALFNLKKHPNFYKCKNYFDGYKESYLSLL